MKKKIMLIGGITFVLLISFFIYKYVKEEMTNADYIVHYYVDNDTFYDIKLKGKTIYVETTTQPHCINAPCDPIKEKMKINNNIKYNSFIKKLCNKNNNIEIKINSSDLNEDELKIINSIINHYRKYD